MTSSNDRKSRLNIVMGAMTFGDAGTEGARVHNTKDIEAILDVFTKHGHSEIDTARVYASGTSERLLGEIDWKSKGLKLETKLYPNQRDPNDVIDHTPEGLRKHLKRSMEALKTDCLEMWYLHAPDRSVPYEITLKIVHELYKEGLFKRFGISNYAAWEVAEIVGICKANGYIQPTAYQGIYNAVHRAVEPELFPCLRKYGISFYEFNPLGGGFFTGRYNNLKPEDADVEAGSRFDPDRVQGKNYRQRYWKEPYFQAIDIIRASAERHGLTQAEVALRWLSHHSYMSPDHEDAVLIGASSLNHIEQNLVDLEKGPLPEDVVKDLDAAWQLVKPHASSYFVPFPA